ncbi:DinB family protein [Sediminibacillus halophilus]|uniref:Uncharacterized damage-inducible protein DinB (Forms a four-helix bundle) n=1 Tax=Sediminibacillus halophilus TaxID=482461 RepID=A0A1G9LPK4_9BACI|nr:DinB family protein [Sediminibacillus halophilus]SDL63764.1 Uncharacterized damage-inducible protein DinB (forms a four-helix bundle) [Sediminibacillus halophilus]
MNLKRLLLDQVNACYGRDTWFVSIKTALNGINAEEASWRNKETNHSIWEIVNHLIYYNGLYLDKFKGESVEETAYDNKATFTEGHRSEWNQTLKLLDQLMGEWIENIEASPETHLEKWVSEINHLALHHTYHVGQIVYIRKAMGRWEAANGVLS